MTMQSTAVSEGRTGDEEAGLEDSPLRASTLELFFDLVFVFAFTQVTAMMAEQASWEGIGEGMLILAAVWWSWGGYAWLTNSLHSDDGIARFGLFSAMAAMLIAALAIPQAFGDDALIFGLAYFAVRVIHIFVYARGAPELGNRDAIRGLAPGLLGAPLLLVLAGVVEDPTARVAIWIVALALDYGTPYIRDVAGFRISATHFAERFGLVVIIALGESIVAIGTGLEGGDLTGGVIVAALAGIVLACTQWWAYFDVVASVAERKLAEARGAARARLARDSWGVMHGLLIAGIILTALGVKKTIGHVDEPLEPVGAAALCGGVAVYLLGHVAIRWRSIHSLNRQRTVTALIALALISVADQVDAIFALLGISALMVALIAYEAVALRERRAALRAAVHA